VNIDCAAAEQIAKTVLYEGYLLYPYRPSALKNHQRWTFGVLHPQGFCLREQAGDRFSSRMECLVEDDGDACIAGKVRFLQSLGSSVVEREVTVGELPLRRLAERPEELSWCFAPLEGAVEVGVLQVADGLMKVRLDIVNGTPFSGGDREQAVASSMLSCHAVLGVQYGRFVSLTDPPPAWAGHAEGCANVGTWPVLIGDPGRRGVLLSSPIILPDYPQVAPESPGDLFDGTEIDEVLSLRVLTLADAEKEEMRRADERTHRLLDRTEALSPEELLAMHGTWRRQAAVSFRPGQRVRLQPTGRADILDLVLRGQEATIVSVEVDLEGRTYLAVTVDSDPGNDLGRLGKPGHRFFFHPADVEPL
jgi:hypothetical protein